MARSDWPSVVTPRDIAIRLGIETQRPDKTLRDFLRANPPTAHAPYERWQFTPAEADAIVDHWRAEH